MADVRLIDANALMKQLRHKLKGTKRFVYLSNREQGWDEAIKSIMSIVHDQHSVLDYEPVRHGEWEHDTCSICGAEWFDWTNMKPFATNYCPSCGAKMNGGKES